MRPADPSGDGGRDPTGDGGWDGGTPMSGLGLAAGIVMVGASSAGWNRGAPAAKAVSNPPGTGSGGGGRGAHARCSYCTLGIENLMSCVVKISMDIISC